MTAWSVAAAATFAVLAVLVIYVLRPRYFTFSNDARIMLGPEWDLTPAEIESIWRCTWPGTQTTTGGRSCE